jgi:hypothetical protein
MGPERLSDRFDEGEDERVSSGMDSITYCDAIESITKTCDSNPVSQGVSDRAR